MLKMEGSWEPFPPLQTPNHRRQVSSTSTSEPYGRQSVVSGQCGGCQEYPQVSLTRSFCPGRATEGKGFPLPLQVMSPQQTQAGAGEACNLPAAGVCRFQPFLPNETYHALGPLPSPLLGKAEPTNN